MERDFKGIWIPKELWLSELSFLEKGLLAEIHSLDGADGCYASNNHFASFLGVSNRRVQQILEKLKAQGHIKVFVKRTKTNKVESRIIHVISPLFGLKNDVPNTVNLTKKISGGSRNNLHDPHEENFVTLTKKISCIEYSIENKEEKRENIQAAAKNFLEFPEFTDEFSEVITEEPQPEPEHTPEEESPPGSAAPPPFAGDVDDTNVPNTYTLEDFKRDYQTTSNSAKLEASWLKLSPAEKEKIRQIVPRYIEYNPDPAYRKSPENFLDLRYRHWESELIDRRPKPQTATQTARSHGKRNSPPKDLLTRKRELAEKHLAILESEGLVKDGRVLTNYPT